MATMVTGPTNLLSGVTTGTSMAVDCSAIGKYCVITTWSTLVTAGQVIIEESNDETYTDTWAPVVNGTISFVAAGKLSFHGSRTGAVIRARVTIPIVGGTVSVDVMPE